MLGGGVLVVPVLDGVDVRVPGALCGVAWLEAAPDDSGSAELVEDDAVGPAESAPSVGVGLVSVGTPPPLRWSLNAAMAPIALRELVATARPIVIDQALDTG
jgi:hypothetical protein